MAGHRRGLVAPADWVELAQVLGWEAPRFRHDSGRLYLEGPADGVGAEVELYERHVAVRAVLAPPLGHVSLVGAKRLGRDPLGHGRDPVPTGDAIFDKWLHAYGHAPRLAALLDAETRRTFVQHVADFSGGPPQWERHGAWGGHGLVVRAERVSSVHPLLDPVAAVPALVTRVARLGRVIQLAQEGSWIRRLGRVAARDPDPRVRARAKDLYGAVVGGAR